MLRTGFQAKRSKPCRAASRTARRKNLVLAMMAGPAAHRVRETVAGLPRCVIAGAKEQVFEFNRPS
ncbi:hypothetical protein CFB45_14735 [Burkholderia sp. HI2500]|nr:hypothetical protein CFB45_14735 [Burkholderia sp. HI2500]